MAHTNEDEGTCPVAGTVAAFDPFDERYLSDPYPFYKKAREEQPVFYSADLDYWIVTRYDDVRQAFLDQEAFSATNALVPIMPLYDSSIQKMIAAGVPPTASLVDEDPPIHAAHRRPYTYLFTPEKVRALEPQIRGWATEYVDRFVKRGRADLVTEFAWEIPALVGFKVIGVEDDEIATLKKFATSTVLMSWGKPSEAEQNEIVAGYCDYYMYMRDLIARAKDPMAADVIGTLRRAHAEDAETFPENYVNNNAANMLIAAHETTTNASGNGFRTLLEHLDAWNAICNDATLIPNAVDEILRYSSSVISWRRIAKRAVRFGDVEVPEGAKLLIVMGSANRDPAVFTDPDTFDIKRANASKNLSFGYGPHLCMGASLAKLEMRVFLEELTRRLPHMRLVPDQEWTYDRNTSFRGPKHVLVAWDPARNPVESDRPARSEVLA